jgi:hypothetical protein
MILLATNGRGVTRAEGSPRDAWDVTTTLEGTRVTCLAVDPRREGVVFAGTHEEGVLRSEDAGRTWRPAGMAGRVVKSLAVDPASVGTLYAGTKPASVFVTTDDGESWEELEAFARVRRWFWMSPAEPPDFRPYVQGLSVSPTDSAVIVAGIEFGAVVRSEDGGATWRGHLRGADRDCHSLTFHGSDGHWVYEAGGGGPAYSRDGGRTWRHTVEGLQGRYCWAVAADPERPEVWYVSAAPFMAFPHVTRTPVAHYDGIAHAAIYRSSGGAPWERLAGGLPQPLDHMPYGLVTHPEMPGHLYAGMANGDVWRSRDHGEGWERLPFSMGRISRCLVIR